MSCPVPDRVNSKHQSQEDETVCCAYQNCHLKRSLNVIALCIAMRLSALTKEENSFLIPDKNIKY